jgi:hypothetical protein
MIIREDHHLVAGFQIESARHHVVRFARVAGEDDLFRRHA